MKRRILFLILCVIMAALTAIGCTPAEEPRDETKPVITCEQYVEIALGETFYYMSGVTAADDVDGDLTHKITVELPTGLTSSDGVVNFTDPGEYVIKYKVSDAAGNTAEKTVTVKVVSNAPSDTVKPVISGYRNWAVKANEPFDVLEGVTATDDIDGDVTDGINIEIPAGCVKNLNGTIVFAAADNYEVIIKVSDTSGNEQRITVYVSVTDIDTTAPVISGPETLTVGRYTWLDVYSGVTATDDVSGDITGDLIALPPEGMRLADNRLYFEDEGVFDIEYKVYDEENNLGTHTCTVTVSGDAQQVNMLENADMELARYTLYSTGGKGTITRGETSATVNVSDIDTTKEIYLERGGVYFQNGLAYSSTASEYSISTTLSGALATGGVRFVAGYYNEDGTFTEMLNEAYVSGTLPIFTPNYTTTNGAFRFVFEKTGQFKISGFTTRSTSSSIYSTRDPGSGNGFSLPNRWIIDSTPSGYSAVMSKDDGVSALKVSVTTGTNTVLQYDNFALENGEDYMLTFDVKASKAVTKTLLLGSASSSQTTTASLSNTYSYEVEIGTEWSQFKQVFTSKATSAMYKIRLTLSGTTDIVYYLTNVKIVKYTPSGADGFIVTVNNIGTVSEGSEDAINAAYQIYAGLTAAEKIEAAAAYALLNTKKAELYGVKYVRFDESAYARGEEIDLNLINTKLDYDNAAFELSSGTAAGGKVSYSEDCYVTAVYTLSKSGAVVAIASREISVVSSQVKAGIVPYGTFNKYKYELITDDISGASIKRTASSVTVNVSSDDGYVCLERSGLNFRPFTTLTALNISYIADGISASDVSVVFGYYLDGVWIELTRKDGVVSGKEFSAAEAPTYTTNNGVMRIELKKTGTFTLTGFAFRVDDNYISRDGTNSPMDAPAYFNLVSSTTIAGLSYNITNNTFNLKYDGNIGNATHICFEDITLDQDVTYTVSFAVKGAADYNLSDALVISNYKRAATSNSYSTSTGNAKNLKTYSFNITQDYTRVEFSYTTSSDKDGDNFYKIMLRMNKVMNISIKDISVYPAA